MDSDRKSKTPTEISIKKTANNGFIVRHSFDNYGGGPSYMPPKEHAFGSRKDMMKHVGGMFGGPDTGGNGAGDGDVDDKDALPDQNSGKVNKARGAQRQGGTGKKHPAPGPRTYGAGVD